MSLDSWQSTVAATRKPLYWVSINCGGTLDVFTSPDAAKKCRAEQNRPHLYRVYRQDAIGHLTEIT
jgi:hypothetical protein